MPWVYNDLWAHFMIIDTLAATCGHVMCTQIYIQIYIPGACDLYVRVYMSGYVTICRFIEMIYTGNWDSERDTVKWTI